MPVDRRQFISTSAAVAGIAALPAFFRSGAAPAQQRLKILMLGGTGFLGPHTVQYALDRGQRRSVPVRIDDLPVQGLHGG